MHITSVVLTSRKIDLPVLGLEVLETFKILVPPQTPSKPQGFQFFNMVWRQLSLAILATLRFHPNPQTGILFVPPSRYVAVTVPDPVGLQFLVHVVPTRAGTVGCFFQTPDKSDFFEFGNAFGCHFLLVIVLSKVQGNNIRKRI